MGKLIKMGFDFYGNRKKLVDSPVAVGIFISFLGERKTWLAARLEIMKLGVKGMLFDFIWEFRFKQYCWSSCALWDI